MRTILTLTLTVAGLAGAVALATPASAQASDRVLIIYGNDKCPTDKNGEEIVVCSRRPEGERYRIPQNLRDTSQSPSNERWAAKAHGVTAAGAAGIGSCSPVGPGGQSGCFNRDVRADRDDNRSRAQSQPDLPNR